MPSTTRSTATDLGIFEMATYWTSRLVGWCGGNQICRQFVTRPVWNISEWIHERLLSERTRVPPSSSAQDPRKGTRAIKHEIHACHTTHVPLRDVTVESLGIVEHVVHVVNTRHIPSRDITVEIMRVIKHVIHEPYSWHVPRRNVAFKQYCILEHPRHRHHSRHIPLRNVRFKIYRATKHVFHSSHVWHIPLG